MDPPPQRGRGRQAKPSVLVSTPPSPLAARVGGDGCHITRATYHATPSVSTVKARGTKPI